jgi:tetratricopeptide (TPR) repeat protein
VPQMPHGPEYLMTTEVDDRMEQEPQSTAQTPESSRRLDERARDRRLNIIIGTLAVAAIGLGSLLAWTVWSDRQAELSSSPALRVIANLRVQVNASPNDANVRVRLGEALATAGLTDEALGQLQSAIKLDPKHSGAYLDVGVIEMEQGKHADADKAFKKVLELTGTSQFQGIDQVREVAYFNLGKNAVADHRYADAVGYLKGALRIRRDASDSYAVLAQAYVGLGDIDAAIEQLNIALTFDPKFADALKAMAQLQLKKGDKKAAVGFAKRAFDVVPEDPEVIELMRSTAASSTAGSK